MAHCAKCGREVPLPEGYGVTFLCEFFYCEDRKDCRAACEATGRTFEAPWERAWRELNEQGGDPEGATYDKGQTWRVGKRITIPTPEQK